MGQCAPVFTCNTFSRNGFVGVVVREGARPLLDNDTITQNKGYGVLLQASAAVTLQVGRVWGLG